MTTLDDMLTQVKQWRKEMWARHEQHPQQKNGWFYRCWQDLYSLETGLMRTIEQEQEDNA